MDKKTPTTTLSMLTAGKFETLRIGKQMNEKTTTWHGHIHSQIIKSNQVKSCLLPIARLCIREKMCGKIGSVKIQAK